MSISLEEEEALLKQDLEDLSAEDLRKEFVNERKRCIVLERDLFKSHTECRRMD
jgi:hypothetical protein